MITRPAASRGGSTFLGSRAYGSFLWGTAEVRHCWFGEIYCSDSLGSLLLVSFLQLFGSFGAHVLAGPTDYKESRRKSHYMYIQYGSKGDNNFNFFLLKSALNAAGGCCNISLGATTDV